MTETLEQGKIHASYQLPEASGMVHKLKRELQEAQQQSAEFVGSLARELLESLVHIRNQCRSINAPVQPGPRLETDETIRDIQDAATRMIAFLQRLQVVQAISSGKPREINTIDLLKLLERLKQLIERRSAERGVRLHIHSNTQSILCRQDCRLLVFILEDLLSGIVHCAPVGSSVEIECCVTSRTAGHNPSRRLHLRILDRNRELTRYDEINLGDYEPGMERNGEAIPGIGPSLLLVNKLLLGMKGSLRCESTDFGTSYHLDLPLA